MSRYTARAASLVPSPASNLSLLRFVRCKLTRCHGGCWWDLQALGVREEALMRAKRFYINIMEGESTSYAINYSAMPHTNCSTCAHCIPLPWSRTRRLRGC